jgi:hypothetical protein
MMNQSIWTALAATLALAGCGDGNQQSISVGSGTTGNISQSQSGWKNSQSISIGNVDGAAKPAKGNKENVVSTQADYDTGNTQSASVGGDAAVSITQTQTGVNRSQSMTVNGKKIETTSK